MYLYMFIVQISCEFSRLYNLYPWYWNTLFYSLISSGKNSAFVHFAAAVVNHYNSYINTEPTLLTLIFSSITIQFFCCTRYPSLLSRPREYGMRSLPDTSTHDQHWKSNLGPFDLESNVPSTQPHASTHLQYRIW